MRTQDNAHIGMSRRPVGDRGSLTVELVVLTPVLLVLALAVTAFGRVAEARQQVAEAARAGAEAAAVQSDPAGARAASAADATVGTADARTCSERQVLTDTSRFVPGGFVTVTVVCRVPLADLSIPGMPGTTTVRATSTAPIDPYRSVTSGFSLSEGSLGSNPSVGGGL
jgi:Flp pilus assembly protein TadG